MLGLSDSAAVAAPHTPNSPKRLQPRPGCQSSLSTPSGLDLISKRSPLQQRVHGNSFDLPPIHPTISDLSSRARNESDSLTMISDLCTSPASHQVILFSSPGTPNSRDSPASLNRSAQPSSNASANPSLSGACINSSVVMDDEAGGNIARILSGFKHSGTHIDQESWMHVSIDVETADTRKAVTMMKGKRHNRRPAAAPPAPDRGSLPRLQVASVEPSASSEAPNGKQSKVVLSPRQASAQEPQPCIKQGISTASGGSPTSPSPRGTHPAPRDAALFPLPLAAAASRTSRVVSLSFAPSKADDCPLTSSESRPSLSAMEAGPQRRRCFGICGGNTEQVVPKEPV